MSRLRVLGVLCVCTQAQAQWLVPPAGSRPVRSGTVSILPGGRLLEPWGMQHSTGPNPIGLAVSPSGKILVTINRGVARPSLTVMQRDKTWEVRQLPVTQLKQVTAGLAFAGEHSVFVSEGNTGRISLIDLDTEEQRRAIDLAPGSDTGDLAFDAARNILYVADLAHSRVVALDSRGRQTLASIDLEGAPVALALGPDRRKLYVTLARNLLQPASAPGVCIIDVSLPRTLRIDKVIPVEGEPGDILATGNEAFVSGAAQDSITVLDLRTGKAVGEIAIRIAGLEALRGVLPMGMALDEKTGWLLVAEAGINAIGVIDIGARKVLGHIPAGWFPTRVAVRGGIVYAANGKGPGGGPNLRGSPPPSGSVSMFSLPEAGALAAPSRFVLEAAGLVDRPGPPAPLPASIRHVVLVIKDGRSFDDVLGDLPQTAMGAPALARFGRDGYVNGQRERLSLHHLNVTPNHHAIAARWAFSDNFYASADTSADGRHWLAEWGELARHGVPVYEFRERFDPKHSDTERVRRVIEDINAKFGSGAEFPPLAVIELPNDRMAPADPDAGFPYEESYLADNDLALGRLVEYFSGTKWWSQMAVFVTEASAEDGIDHIDARRTLLLCAGPWARKNSVIHANASFAALRKTIFRLLGLPPATLFDAAAADLSECFAKTPDPAPYRALPVDPRLYRP